MIKPTEKVFGGTGFMTGEATAKRLAQRAADIGFAPIGIGRTLLHNTATEKARNKAVQEMEGQTAVLHSAHNILITTMMNLDTWPGRLILADAPKPMSKPALVVGGTRRQIQHTLQGLNPWQPHRAEHLAVAGEGYREFFGHLPGYWRLLDEISETNRFELAEAALEAGVEVGLGIAEHDPIFPTSKSEAETAIGGLKQAYGEQFFGYVHAGDHDVPTMHTTDFLRPFAEHFKVAQPWHQF